MVEDLGFTFTVQKSGEIAIHRDGRVVAVLRGPAAEQFHQDVSDGDPQQIMARVTGNYRRGNERKAGRHPRNR